MESMHYIGLDIHKKMIAFCIKSKDGTIVDHGVVAANREVLMEWIKKHSINPDGGDGGNTFYRLGL